MVTSQECPTERLTRQVEAMLDPAQFVEDAVIELLSQYPGVALETAVKEVLRAVS